MAIGVEDLVNQALREIGYPKPIQDIYEGSRASKAALDIYFQSRDELLDAHDWPFARRNRALVREHQSVFLCLHAA